MILCVYLKIFFLLLRKKSLSENFANWKLRPLFVFVTIQNIFFILNLIANAPDDFFSGIVDPILFIH